MQLDDPEFAAAIARVTPARTNPYGWLTSLAPGPAACHWSVGGWSEFQVSSGKVPLAMPRSARAQA